MAEATEEQHEHWEFPDSSLLVIDDAAENRELLTLVLGELGLSADTAENGAIGVELAANREYDVILSDIQMPVMDGYETAKALRASGRTAPIIALTANAMKGYEEVIMQSGFSHYMTKPIDVNALTKLLAKLLNGKPVAAPRQSTAAATAPLTGQAANDEQLIYSTLGSSEKMKDVVERFINRLNEQLPVMVSAFEQRDYQELANMGHWLKGSGGTVGFLALSQPAHDLEVNAKAEEDDAISANLETISDITRRLRSGSTNSPNTPTQSTPKTVTTKDSDLSAVDPIQSKLLSRNPSFRPIVTKFLPRLTTQLAELDKAISLQQFDEIALLAHWLKGSGGTVGFDVFTDPAAEMEASALRKDIDEVIRLYNKIRSYADRIVVPDAENDDASKMNKSA